MISSKQVEFFSVNIVVCNKTVANLIWTITEKAARSDNHPIICERPNKKN